ncbi:MAG: aminoacyl-tRNA hydrolase, partial [Deltaproteobacteria bacterium]|nr:aminoacyl-tRNA hydrolase [Deltaproteobacteria bacterium]
MYLIVGLGNPGPEYSKTRHNVGFWVIEALAERWKIDLSKKKFKSHYGEGFFQNEKVILSLPQTFMNLSGESVAAMTDFYKIPLDQLIVIHDEMDLEIGRLKVVREGGPAGHRGVASIQQLLATQSFCRFRIGIGKPSHKTKTNGFVLGE